MKAEILQAIKTSYQKYGLKVNSIEKLSSLIEANIAAMGTLEADKLTEAIANSIKAYEPMVELIQSEVDSRASKKPADPAPSNPPTPTTEPDQAIELVKAMRLELDALKKERDIQAQQTSRGQLLSQAAELAVKNGATNKAVMDKIIRLVDVKDGMTSEQISAEIVREYNELHSNISSQETGVPRIPSNTLSDSEIAKARELAIAKSAEQFQKKAHI